MVEMRDGIRLATDLYRPARDGELVAGPLPDDRLHHAVRQDRAALHRDRRLLRPARLRRRAAGPPRPAPLRGDEGVLPLARRRTRARTATTRSSGSPRSRGRTAAPAWSAARTPCITQIRTALEAPPHLTAIWPDVAPTNVVPPPDARGRRDAAAHVLGALHPRRRRAGGAGRPELSRRTSGTTCATCGSCSGSWPWHKGELALRHVPALDETLENYCTRGAYDEWWARKENDFTRYFARPRRHPGDDDDRLVRRLPARRHRVLRGDGGEERGAAAADRRAVEPRRHARRRDVHARRRLRRGLALGRAALLRGAARVLRPLAAGRRDRPAGATRRRCGSS